MFKFNFSQVLDYPLDEEDSDSEGRERRDGIRIDQDEPQEPIRTDVCLDVTLEELVSHFFFPNAQNIDRPDVTDVAKNTVVCYHIYAAYRRQFQQHQYSTTGFVRC